jgi:hypothetical protein
MQTVPLEPIPNQRLGIRLGGDRYDITLKEVGGVMSVTILRGDVTLVQGLRCVAGTPLIPYSYLATSGNFIFVTENEELPDWRLFGSTQTLVYASSAELGAL